MRQIVRYRNHRPDPRSGSPHHRSRLHRDGNRRLTGPPSAQVHQPEREIDAGAQAVHGITLEFLADKPKFADIVDEFPSSSAAANWSSTTPLRPRLPSMPNCAASTACRWKPSATA